MKPWQTPAFKALLNIALAEDLDSGDATSQALILPSSVNEAEISTKSTCIVAGQWVAQAVFMEVDRSLEYQILIEDGQLAHTGCTIATIAGNTASILAGERLALNFLQRLSGIATSTHDLVTRIGSSACKVVDTRKTVPGMRQLDKYAVRMGGGFNHRMNLADGILIKDNHIKACNGISNAVSAARTNACHTLKIQVEVTTMTEAEEAASSGADSLLLDNMAPDLVHQITKRFGSSLLLECSGNLCADNIRVYSNTGVHILSVGSLTHSVHAADLSLNLR